MTFDSLHLRPFSRPGFLSDLVECNGLICNAGFELAREALYLGKRVLVKPIAGQMEQASNALAICRLNIGMTMKALNPEQLTLWLNSPALAPMDYPNVASILAQWIENGRWEEIEGLARYVWGLMKTNFLDYGVYQNNIPVARGPGGG